MKSILKVSALLLALVVVSFGMQSCGGGVKKVTNSELGGYWVLKTLNGENAADAFKGAIPFLQIDTLNGAIHGNAGCNIYNGAYTLNELNEFSAPNAMTTMMACMEENKEPDFLKAMSQPATLSVVDGVLTFKNGETVVMEFVQGEEPKAVTGEQAVNAETLAGEWVLTKLSGVPAGDVFKDGMPTIIFNADGTVNGNAGCNTYRSSYELKEASLVFGPLMSTKMACPSLEGENSFSKILSAPVFATINGVELFFTQDGKEVMVLTKKISE